ncbi:MAG: hypothetical protein PWP30_950 [Eubacteriaceae bacterium]|jgi:hypothetical protein|nr:hypothetical protein [Eubacteriaceae bacterium]
MTKKLLPLMLILVLLLSACTNSSNSDSAEADPLSDGKAYLQEEMDGLQSILEEIGSSVGDAAPGDQAIYAMLNEQLNSKTYFYDILLTDAQTNVTQVASKVDAPFIGLNLKSINTLNELFVDSPMLVIKQNANSDDTPFLYASVPTENGGWVIAYIDPYSFGAEFSSFAIGQELRVYANTEPGSNSSVSELRAFTAEELSWLDQASDYINDEFTTLETLTDAAVSAYQESGPDSPAFSTALAQISQDSLIAKNVVFVDTDNMIVTSFPTYLEGISFDLYDLDIPSLTSDRQPFITEVNFSDVQTSALKQLGFVTPVVKDDEIAGYILVQARLFDLAADLSSLKEIGQNVNFMLTDSQGTILYDGDIAEVGKNIYNDDLYSDGTLQDYLQNEFKTNPEGESSYEFYGAGMTEIIPKEVTWKTITFMWENFKLSMNSEWKPAQ